MLKLSPNWIDEQTVNRLSEIERERERERGSDAEIIPKLDRRTDCE